MKPKRCKGISKLGYTRDGPKKNIRCQAYAMKGTDYCFAHTPGRNLSPHNCPICGRMSNTKYNCRVCRRVLAKNILKNHGEQLLFFVYQRINMDHDSYYSLCWPSRAAYELCIGDEHAESELASFVDVAGIYNIISKSTGDVDHAS